jgi:hypothetical protein
MGAAPYISIAGRSAETGLMTEIDLQDIQDARLEGSFSIASASVTLTQSHRDEREGRQRWQ